MTYYQIEINGEQYICVHAFSSSISNSHIIIKIYIVYNPIIKMLMIWYTNATIFYFAKKVRKNCNTVVFVV